MLLGIVLAPVLIFAVVVGVVYWKQASITQELVATLNHDFEGEVVLHDTHISPFVNFPYISIDLEELTIYEDKTRATAPLLQVKDIYLGFDLLTILKGVIDINSIKMKEGTIRIVQHPDGEINIINALSSKKPIEDAGEEFHIHLKSIELANIDIIKINEADSLTLEIFINDAQGKFQSAKEHLMIGLNSRFLFNLISGADTTFIKHKHFDIHTQLDFNKVSQLLTIQPSEVKLENGVFGMSGSIDVDDDLNLNLAFNGNKPNFDLLLAFVPEELVPTLKKYDNQGNIFFKASVVGKSINGNSPQIVADFGCEEAFFTNTLSNRKLDDLFFKGHFTNGESRNASTMEFSLLDISARPEAGLFKGNLKVRNFDSPEIDMRVQSEFDLDFLANFLDIPNLQNLKGQISLTMNFRDIIDLQNPEKSIEKLNESYYTKLVVKDLSFSSPNFHLPVKDLNIEAEMDGHKAMINQFRLKIGDSDIFIKATISDLPAILHHTRDEVLASMDVRSNLLDIHQLTSSDTSNQKPIDEQIENLSLRLKFKTSARAFTESPNLPTGEFFIEDLFATMKHYPHTLHDFHADVFVDEEDFRVIDFTGIIDNSDFHFTGKLRHYDLWFANEPLGDTQVTFNLTSTLLQLEDLFSYGGENYVPEDYRHEEFRQLNVKGHADLHFNQGLKSADLYLDNLEGQMKIHPLRLEKFNGRIHIEDQHLVVENFSGKLGRTNFTANLNYYLGSDSTVKKRDNYFSIVAPHLDFDELFNYNPPPSNTPSGDHEAGFNIYSVPFTDMKFDLKIDHLNYHRYLFDNFYAKLRSQQNHYIYVDTMSMMAAGGNINLKGYFNGSDKSRIYFSPDLNVKEIDLDKLLFKFENFGQDHLVSENLHGKLSGSVKGKVHLHADMVPIIDDSDLHLNVEVVGGRLENYSALQALSEFFGDKNLKKVFFDTLRNKIDLKQGVMTVPAMTINSSLGFIEVSGKQDMQMNMEYYLRIPWKVITQAGSQKLFGKKTEEVDPSQIDAIEYRDKSKTVRFLNLKISGTPENFKVDLGKNKDYK